jgi:hypothetical protein
MAATNIIVATAADGHGANVGIPVLPCLVIRKRQRQVEREALTPPLLYSRGAQPPTGAHVG